MEMSPVGVIDGVLGGGASAIHKSLNYELSNALLLDVIVNNFPGGISVFDKSLKMVICNIEQRRLLEYPDSLFANGPPTLEEVFRFNAERGEYGEGVVDELVQIRMERVKMRQSHHYRRSRPNGRVLEIRGTPVADGGFVTMYLDVTAQSQREAAATHRANHDALTKLPNRFHFRTKLEADLNRAVTKGEYVAIHCLDVDGFKRVNDTYGHAIGDDLLVEIGRRLRNSVRETDTVARLGGDEFAISQIGVRSRENVLTVAERILESIGRPFHIRGTKLSISTSIGIVLSRDPGNLDAALEFADGALYESKRSGKNKATICNEFISLE